MRGLERRKKSAAFLLVEALILSSCSSWEHLWERASQSGEARSLDAQSAARKTLPAAPEVDTTGWTREKLFAYFNKLRGDAYPLDEIPRHLETPDSKVPCLAEDQQLYRGTHVKFIPLTVHPAFVDRLSKLEHLFAEEAKSFYGRPPRTVLHEGGYACRTSHLRATRISEHAFGNAIDITGFSFGPLPPEEAKSVSDAIPKGAFQVRVLSHWDSNGSPLGDLHQSFLRGLGKRIVEEKVVRVVLGPSHRGHQSHFHLDMSPWRYVDL